MFRVVYDMQGICVIVRFPVMSNNSNLKVARASRHDRIYDLKREPIQLTSIKLNHRIIDP